ncbi:MAG: sugar phosphate isomerase/epimerase [Oscillospiraceae bacterium]|nr:sugar phosphate isomerase/epimerase [Oscillospiraceae bacterium]
MKFAVQLYSLRHHISSGEDLLAILERVKELGFDGVEFAGFQGLSAEDLRAKLDETGLKCVGAHMSINDMREENLQNSINYIKTLGSDIFGIGGADTATETSLNEVIEVLGNADKIAQQQGMKVYFHNHTSEFTPPLFAEKPGTIFDRLKESCHMQIDTYWSFAAGQDNYKLITENKERIVDLHIKDGKGHTPTALGEGENDLDAVIRAAKDAGIEWLVLENDDPVPDGLSDIERSMKWLNANAR